MTQSATLEGVGESTVSQDEADKAARVAVIKQLEVSVEGKDSSMQRETGGGGFDYAVSSEIVERVNMGISGMEIVSQHADSCRGRYFSRARLDRAKAVHAWQVELRNAAAQRQELARALTEAQTRHDYFAAVGSAARLLDLDTGAAIVERRLEFLAPDQRPLEPSARRAEQARRLLDDLLDTLQLAKVSGDEQRAVHGTMLDQPLVVRLTAGDTPVADVPVQFAVTSGRAEIDSVVRTNAQGLAQATVRQVAAGEASAQFVARIQPEHLAALLPPSVRPRVVPRAEQLSATFAMLPPVFHLVARLRALSAEAEGLQATVSARQAEHDVIRILLPLYRLAEIQEEWSRSAKLVDAASAGARGGIGDPGDPMATRRQLDALLDSLQLKRHAGDNQTARPGRPLAQPLIAQVVAVRPTGEFPLPEWPVQFAFENGQGDVEPLVRTDGDGRARAAVRQVAPAPTKATIVARISVDQLGIEMPIPLRQGLERRLGVQTVRFSITPPLPSPDTPLAKSLHDLALRLAMHVNDSQGAPAVMRGFVENRSRRRLSISARIENALSSGLTQNGAVQLTETAESNIATRNVGANRQPAAAIFGVYESDADGSLWITAKLRRLNDDVIEAMAEGTIPRAALSEADVRELNGTKSTGAPAPIFTAPAPSESYRQWVEEFWDLRNPAGFKTELTPERPQYQEDEKAVFRFRTEQDCYLTVVNIGASGSWTVLLPNQWRADSKDTLVRASEGWVAIPGSQDKYDFTVSRPAGTERIKAICTTRPIRLVASMDLSQGLFQMSPKDEHRLRDLKVTQAPVRRDEWSEAKAEIVTLEAGQSETRGLRGLKSRGLAPVK